MAPMRRAGPFGLLLMVFDLWRRLPPKQRRQLMKVTRKHGPKVAKAAAKRARSRRSKKP